MKINTTQQGAIRLFRAVLSAVVLSPALLLLPCKVATSQSAQIVSYRALSMFGGDFTLSDHHGERFSLNAARGKIVVLYFGFTSCADTCPLTLAGLAAALRRLGPLAGRIQPLFITLDPQRDTPEHLRDYLGFFHPAILGLRGSEDEIARVAEQYRAPFYIHKPDPSGFYVVDHSSYLFVVDATGTLVNLIRHATPAPKIAGLLKQLLAP